MFDRQLNPLTSGWAAIWLVAILAGCQPAADSEVVVYTALDRQFSEPLFEAFTRQTGIHVRAKYDSEANKTVGLANLIINEKQRPRCDLFWNNEILNTLRLQGLGLLRAYRSPLAADYPADFRSPDGHWYGFAARARVLLVNTQRLADRPVPSSIQDLVDPRWKGQVGVAKPLFGTTSTHAACLFARWGRPRAQAFFRQLRENARILPGNRQVAQAVAGNQLCFGLTDTDDALLELNRGMPVQIVYPDQGPDGLGTLFIPQFAGAHPGQSPSASRRATVGFPTLPRNGTELGARTQWSNPTESAGKPVAAGRHPQIDPANGGRLYEGSRAVGNHGRLLTGVVRHGPLTVAGGLCTSTTLR